MLEVSQLLAQGFARHQQGKLIEAKEIYQRILKIQPQHFDALQLLGLILVGENENHRALELFNQALSIDQSNAAVFYNRGTVFRRLRQFDAALASYEQALALRPEYAEAYYNRANVFKELRQFDAALQSYDQAITLRPDDAKAHSNRGNVLQELGQFDAALESYQQALSLRPDLVEAWSNQGKALQELGRFDAALQSYDQALIIQPDLVEAHSNRGNVLQELGHYEAALVSYEQAIAFKPDYADVYANRGLLYKELGQLSKAKADLQMAVQLFFEVIRNQIVPKRPQMIRPMSVPDAATALLEFKTLLDQHDIPFFFIKGTLLGIYRDGEQLPYDKDIDLGLPWDIDRNTLLELFEQSSEFTVQGNPSTAELEWNLVVEHLSTGVTLDLFFFKPEGQSVLCGFHQLPKPLLWKFSTFNLAPIQYHGAVFQMPHDPEKFLTEIYGEAWRIPDPYFDSVVSGLNLQEGCRDISLSYAYHRLYLQLSQMHWKKALGYCQQIRVIEAQTHLDELVDWLEIQIQQAV